MNLNQSVLKRFLIASSIAFALPLAAEAHPMQDEGHGRCGAETMPGAPFMGGGALPQGHFRGAMMRGDKFFGDGPVQPFLRGLDLSEAQRDKIFSILHAQAPLMREQAKTAHKVHEELRALVTSGDYDDAKAKALAESGARAMSEMALLHARRDHQIYALLTPEQHMQAEKMKADFESRPMSGGGDRPGPHR